MIVHVQCEFTQFRDIFHLTQTVNLAQIKDCESEMDIEKCKKIRGDTLFSRSI